MAVSVSWVGITRANPVPVLFRINHEGVWFLSHVAGYTRQGVVAVPPVFPQLMASIPCRKRPGVLVWIDLVFIRAK